MKCDSFEIAMLIKEIYSETMSIVSYSLKDSGLTHQQIMIIKLIAHNKGKTNISLLCDEMHLAKGTISGIVKRLENMGYIEKLKNDDDKRNTYVTFSQRGIEFAKKFRKDINSSFDKIFENFSEEEKQEVKKNLIKLRNRIKENE